MYFKGYEIRGKYDAIVVGGRELTAHWMGANDYFVVDKSAYNRGEYNKVVAHVTSLEAAEAVRRLCEQGGT